MTIKDRAGKNRADPGQGLVDAHRACDRSEGAPTAADQVNVAVSVPVKANHTSSSSTDKQHTGVYREELAVPGAATQI
jgi:hypothetical protein